MTGASSLLSTVPPRGEAQGAGCWPTGSPRALAHGLRRHGRGRLARPRPALVRALAGRSALGLKGFQLSWATAAEPGQQGDGETQQGHRQSRRCVGQRAWTFAAGPV